MPAEGPRPMAGCAPAPSDDALRPLCLPRAEAQLLQPAVFLTTLLHASLTSRVSMAMGPDSIKCLDGGSLGTQAGRRGVKPGKHRAFWEFLPAPHAHQILRSRLVCRRRAPTTRPDSCTGLQPASRPGQSFRSAPAPRLPSHQWEQSWGRKDVLARTGCCCHCPLRGTPTHLAAVSEVYRHAGPSWSSAGRSCSLAG